MDNFKLQKASKEDLEIIWDIEQDIASRISGRIENIEGVREYYFDYSTDVFLIIVREVVVGVVAVSVGKKETELSSLLLKKTSQDKGLGRFVLRKVVEQFGDRKMFLFTHPENVRSLITYMKCGFVIKEWIDNKFGDGEPRVRMARSAKILA